jgi:hypothetical protein
MWFRRRRRDQRDGPASATARIKVAPGVGDDHGDDRTSALPAVRAERALMALAVHAQQLDERLARIEARLDADEAAAVAAAESQALETATHDELLEVRLHSARVAAEVSRMSVELQARIDDLAVQIPPVVAEDRKQQRARVFAETVLDLADGLDTQYVDLRDAPGGWANTA